MPTDTRPTESLWIIDGYRLHLEDAWEGVSRRRNLPAHHLRLLSHHDPCKATSVDRARYLRELRSGHSPPPPLLHHVLRRTAEADDERLDKRLEEWVGRKPLKYQTDDLSD